MSGERPRSRYAERLDALEALSGRLSVVGVPHSVKRYTRNGAPGSPAEREIPQLQVAGDLVWVRVLYWRDRDGRSVPRFSVSGAPKSTWPVDDAGVDQLASVLVMRWLDHRARRDDPNERRM